MARPLVSEQTVLDALAAGQTSVSVPENALVTAQARDTAKAKGVEMRPVASGQSAVAESSQPPGASATSGRAPATGSLPLATGRDRTLALGCDHVGFAYKETLAAHARTLGWTILDVGTDSDAAVDYPDFAFAVARAVQTGKARFGLMIDGVGVGSAIVANKVSGIRAALCPDVFSAFNARAHNDANVLTLGSRTMGTETCKRVVSEFLAVAFEGGRHAARVQKITDVEARFLPGASVRA